MSRILVDQIRSNSASNDAFTLDGAGNVTVPGNITLSGNATLSGTATGFPKGKAHNLIINGAMNVAQRGTSSTSTYYQTVDRFQLRTSGVDEAPTQAQVDVASGTTPYTLGFRKAYRITNGNQTSGAGAGDYVFIRCMLEAQDMATSGWNYVSSSSNITFSFWVKSSVAQTFYCSIYTKDGTSYSYPFETGSLSADTWTKVTKTLPGNSNLQFDNDANEGLRIQFFCFQGTNKTGSVTLNQWSAYDDAAQTPDSPSTWYTTNDATFEITGVQLEVGDSATDFEHKSYGDELALCERYYEIVAEGNNNYFATTAQWNSGLALGAISYRTTKRAIPSLVQTTGTNYYFQAQNGSTPNFNNIDHLSHGGAKVAALAAYVGGTAGYAGLFSTVNAAAHIALDAEL